MNTRSMSTDAERDKYAKLIGQLKYICLFYFDSWKLFSLFSQKLYFIIIYIQRSPSPPFQSRGGTQSTENIALEVRGEPRRWERTPNRVPAERHWSASTRGIPHTARTAIAYWFSQSVRGISNNLHKLVLGMFILPTEYSNR